jgi:hypothetical protein
MPDFGCNVLLTHKEVRERNHGVHPARHLRYGDRCNLQADGFFRIERPNGPPVIISRCNAHCKNVAHGLNDQVVTRMTYEEAIVSEVHDA